MAQMSGEARAAKLSQRGGDYGFDAPLVPIILGVVGLASWVLALIAVFAYHATVAALVWLGYGLVFMLSAAVYLHTTRRGKFQVWADTLTRLDLRGDERIIDLGCGRGAVLTMAAQCVPNGHVVGVDIWQTRDQSGNSEESARRNAELEGVASRVELITADMRALPCEDGAFDVALSSVAIHNIPKVNERLRAIDEAARALKPGGRLRIVDIRSTDAYSQRLRELGMTQVERRLLGWRMWYGGPWVAATLVSATKPPRTGLLGS